MRGKVLLYLRLLFFGVLLEAVYFVFLVRPFWLGRYYATPLLDLGKITDHKPWEATAVVMAMILTLYILAYRLATDDIPGWLIIALGTIFAITQLCTYPIGALDIFDYIFYGRQMSTYGANPYLEPPRAFAHDPLYQYVGWTWLPFTYGPLWALICWVLNAFGRESILANLLLFKVIAVAAYVAAGVGIHIVLREKAPQYAARGTLLFAWNPLVIFEVAANGHNDIFLVLFMVMGIIAFAKARHCLAIGSLALSVFIKFVSAPLGLVWLIAGLRATVGWSKRLSLVAGSLLVVLFLAILFYIPFLRDTTAVRTVLLAPLMRQHLFTTSFPALFVFGADNLLDRVTAECIARNVAVILLAIVTLRETLRVEGTWCDLVRASFNIIAFYLLFLCPWFQPWYVMWLVPLAALLPPGWQTTTTILFCASATTKYLVFDYFLFLIPALQDVLRVEALAVALIYIPPLAYLARALRRG